MAGVPVPVSMQAPRRPCRLPKADKCYVREGKEQTEVLKDERQDEREMSLHLYAWLRGCDGTAHSLTSPVFASSSVSPSSCVCS